MSLFNAFKAAGSAMQAQTQRLNTVASNMANVETAASNPDDVYKARKVVFQAELDKAAPGQAALARCQCEGSGDRQRRGAKGL